MTREYLEEPVVVVGFAGRLPQDADTPAGFWKILQDGRNTSTEVPSDRVNMDAFYNPNMERPDTVGSFIPQEVSTNNSVQRPSSKLCHG